MGEQKKSARPFDPTSPTWKHRLWVRLDTPDGLRTFIFWSRIWKVLVIGVLGTWLGLASVAWVFVKYRRGIAEVRFVDVALLPLRHAHYEQTLSHHYFALAKKQLEADDWTRAIANLRLTLARDPQNSEARRLLANLFIQHQRPDLAVKALAAGLDQGARDPDGLLTLFSLLHDTNQPDRIVALGRRLLPDTPDQLPLHRQLVPLVAQAGIDLNHFAEAGSLLARWQLDTSPEGIRLLAQIDLATGHPEAAVDRLEAQLQLHPDDEATGIQLTGVYRQMNRLEDAYRTALRRALKHPDSPGARADLLVLLGQTKAPAAAFDREFTGYINRFGHDERTLVLLAQSSVLMARPDLALQVQDLAPRDKFGRVNPLFPLLVMQAQFEAKDYVAVVASAASMTAVPNLAPDQDAVVCQLTCLAQYQLHRDLDGDASLARYLELNYQSVTARSLKFARQLDDLGRRPAARQLLQAGFTANPDDPRVLLALATHDVKDQAWAEVSRNLPQLLKLDPAPRDLLQAIWQQGGKALSISPDLQQQLQNLAQ